MQRFSPAVVTLLVVNVAIHLAGLSPGLHAAMAEFGALWFPTNPHFWPWQLVSYMFLHSDLNHIFFNMLALVLFGVIMEREWGAARFLLFFFVCGVGAALIQAGTSWMEYAQKFQRLVAAGLKPAEIDALMAAGRGVLPEDETLRAKLRELYALYLGRTVGASGAIYGLLVAYGVRFPNAKMVFFLVPIPLAAKYVLPVMLGLDFFSGVTGFSLFGGGIAHFAHLGGAFIGCLLALRWRQRSQPEVGPRAAKR